MMRSDDDKVDGSGGGGGADDDDYDDDGDGAGAGGDDDDESCPWNSQAHVRNGSGRPCAVLNIQPLLVLLTKSIH